MYHVSVDRFDSLSEDDIAKREQNKLDFGQALIEGLESVVDAFTDTTSEKIVDAKSTICESYEDVISTILESTLLEIESIPKEDDLMYEIATTGEFFTELYSGGYRYEISVINEDPNAEHLRRLYD